MPAMLIPLLILICLRLLFLDARPIHHDEAVNGWFIDGMFQRGFYIYDPQNYHGPLLFYWTALSEKLFGRSVTGLRIPAVLFGALLTLSPFLYRRWIGRWGAYLAAAMLAVSPGMIFFSRYAIHESGFACFEALFLALWLRIREDGWTQGRTIGLGLTLGALAGLKENFVLFGAAILLAEGVLWFRRERPAWRLDAHFARHALLAAGAAMALIALAFTGGFQDDAGLGKFFEAFAFWTRTGTGGNGHDKPFYYWLGLFSRYEWSALLGLVFLPAVFLKTVAPLRLIGATGAFLFLIYSLVPYKTPWCLLSFQWPLVIFAGAILGAWMETRKSWRRPIGFILAAAASLSLAQALNVAYLNPDQDEHPYIYGQTYGEMLPPVERILERVRTAGAQGEPQIQVVSTFTWPLPYLLGELHRVAYFGEANVPAALGADFLIIDEPLLVRFQGRVSGQYHRECVRARQWASRICFLTRTAP